MHDLRRPSNQPRDLRRFLAIEHFEDHFGQMEANLRCGGASVVVHLTKELGIPGDLRIRRKSKFAKDPAVEYQSWVSTSAAGRAWVRDQSNFTKIALRFSS